MDSFYFLMSFQPIPTRYLFYVFQPENLLLASKNKGAAVKVTRPSTE